MHLDVAVGSLVTVFFPENKQLTCVSRLPNHLCGLFLLGSLRIRLEHFLGTRHASFALFMTCIMYHFQQAMNLEAWIYRKVWPLSSYFTPFDAQIWKPAGGSNLHPSSESFLWAEA